MSKPHSSHYYAKDSVRLDKAKIIEDSQKSLKVPAIISKSGVYDYPDGAAYKSPAELLKATRTARYAKLTIRDHPDTLVIMSQEQLFGGVLKPRWDRNKIRAILDFDKEVTPTVFLQEVRLALTDVGEPMDNSIGFYYRPEFTPGMAPDVNTGKMRKFDYFMRDIVIDHVAAGAFVGRCTAPSCGVGLDTYMRRIALDPFGEYRNMSECIAANQDKKSPAGYCAWLHKKITGKWPGQNAQDVGLFSLIGDVITMDKSTYGLIFGDARRPSKEWMKKARANAEGFPEVDSFCYWLWYHGPEELKNSFGASNVSIKGVKKKLSQEEETPYAKCVREKKAAGMTAEEAAEACKQLKTDQDEESPYKKCISEKKAEGMSQEEAEEACEALKPAAADQEGEKTPWQLCIQAEMAKGKDKEQARMACKEKGLKGPAQEQDQEPVAQPVETQEVLPTPLETCIATRMEAHGEDEATAKKWCEDEAAGLHQPVSDILDNIARLKEKKRKLNRQ